ncbi:hypothetical protein PGTUg99_021029 [Puccinia graminis f. sp. tritici]|uniref:Uncharacterized protein n=1 Tax=Puccinia graminis f. sp. tritici TaxID=56615 RepID=A0A5B0S7H7_PUCGR|nr:hypothetical protein PGTUg99_021029 [Puccinia graminis f. sp. tritici]
MFYEESQEWEGMASLQPEELETSGELVAVENHWEAATKEEVKETETNSLGGAIKIVPGE